MDGRAFYDAIDSDPNLDWLGTLDQDIPNGIGESCVFICHSVSGIIFRVPVTAILEEEEDALLAILRCERDPIALVYMTRVVGYFSLVHNWNKSKVEELRDRGKGSYALPGESDSYSFSLKRKHQ